MTTRKRGCERNWSTPSCSMLQLARILPTLKYRTGGLFRTRSERRLAHVGSLYSLPLGGKSLKTKAACHQVPLLPAKCPLVGVRHPVQKLGLSIRVLPGYAYIYNPHPLSSLSWHRRKNRAWPDTIQPSKLAPPPRGRRCCRDQSSRCCFFRRFHWGLSQGDIKMV